MIYFGGLGGIIALFLWVFALIDLITTDEVLTRNLPKGVWLLIVIFIPLVGSLLWLIAGRPEGASLRPGGTASSYGGTQHPVVRRRLPPTPLGPEDSPDFIASIGEREHQLDEWEQDLRRREEELRRREDDDGPSDPSPA